MPQADPVCSGNNGTNTTTSWWGGSYNTSSNSTNACTEHASNTTRSSNATSSAYLTPDWTSWLTHHPAINFTAPLQPGQNVSMGHRYMSKSHGFGRRLIEWLFGSP